MKEKYYSAWIDIGATMVGARLLLSDGAQASLQYNTRGSHYLPINVFVYIYVTNTHTHSIYFIANSRRSTIFVTRSYFLNKHTPPVSNALVHIYRPLNTYVHTYIHKYIAVYTCICRFKQALHLFLSLYPILSLMRLTHHDHSYAFMRKFTYRYIIYI